MFTGIIDEVGVVETVTPGDSGTELRIGSAYRDLQRGESVAVNGACLTVRDCGDGWFTVAAVTTTRGRTAIGDWHAGRRVNLELAMKLNARFGGHIVQGHVDGVAVVAGVERVDDAVVIDIELPRGLGDTVVPHGSVTVDGVSLTVNSIDCDVLQVSLIEYTLHHSTLGDLRKGSRVHIETDVIGKYVRRVVAPYLNS